MHKISPPTFSVLASLSERTPFEVDKIEIPRPSKFLCKSLIFEYTLLPGVETLEIVCRSFQLCSPVSSYVNPIPSSMPGYESDLIMAGGTFVDGSTSEFSADAPLRPPYNLYVQGGTHRAHIKIAITQAVIALVQSGIVDLP